MSQDSVSPYSLTAESSTIQKNVFVRTLLQNQTAAAAFHRRFLTAPQTFHQMSPNGEPGSGSPDGLGHE